MKSIRIGNDIRIEWPIVLSGDVEKLQDLDLTVEVRPSAKIIDTHNYADAPKPRKVTVMMNGGITCRPDIGDGKEHCRPRPCPPHNHRPVPPAPVRLPYHIEDNTLIAMWTADRQFATGDYDIILYAHKNEGGQAVCDQYRFVRLVSHTAQADAPDDSGIEAVIAMQPVTLELSGLSAYEVAVVNGFQGTEEEWLQSLKQPAIDAAEQAKEDIEQFKTETKAELKEDIDNLNANTGVDEYPAFTENEAYLAGDIVNYQGKLYRFTSDHAAGTWTGTDVEDTSIDKITKSQISIGINKKTIKLSGEWAANISIKNSGIFLYKDITYYLRLINYTGSSKGINAAIHEYGEHSIAINMEHYVPFTPTHDGYLMIYTYPSINEYADVVVEILDENYFKLRYNDEIVKRTLNVDTIHVDFPGGNSLQNFTSDIYMNEGDSITVRKISDYKTHLLIYIADDAVNNQEVTESFKEFTAQSSGFLRVQINDSNAYKGEIVLVRNKSRLDLIDLNTELTVNTAKSSGTYYYPFKPIKGAAYCIETGNTSCNLHLYNKDKVKVADIKVFGRNDSEVFIVNESLEEVEFIGGYFSTILHNFTVRFTSLLAKTRKDTFVYISEDGDDKNLGTSYSPLKTLNRALQLSNRVIVKDGVYHDQYLDCAGKIGDIEIIADDSSNPIFMLGDIVATENGTLYEDGIYKISVSSDPNCKLLFQFNVGDTETFIDKDKRHYLQGQRTYRNDCTSLYRVDELSQLSEHTFSYYYSNSEHCIYVKTPSVVSDSNFLFAPSDTDMFNNIENVNIHIKGINIYGGNGRFKTNGKFVAKDCSVKYAKTGWSNNNSKGAVLYHCEAAGIISELDNIYGDGFSTSLEANNEDANLNFPIVSMIMIDCYSHDNWNDGYSSHYNSSVTIYGGVFEYNCIGEHGAGLTPSFGACDVIYNAISQYNNNHGFFYTADGSQAIGTGTYGVCQCFNMISRGNKNDGFRINTENNVVELKDCISYNNDGYGYFGVSGGIMRLINCYVNNNLLGDKNNFITSIECSKL